MAAFKLGKDKNIHFVFNFSKRNVIIILMEVKYVRSFFLLKLGVYGIKNIETPVEFSFYKKTINKDFDPSNYMIKGIYGENGSGKTAVITAINILRNLINDKDYLFNSVNQLNLSELINKKTKSSKMEIEYISCVNADKYIYHYSISFQLNRENRVEISNEIFDVKKGTASKNIYRRVYETKDGELIYFDDEENYGYFKEKTQNLLRQRSFASFVVGLFEPGKKELVSIALLNVLLLYVFSHMIYTYFDKEDDHSNYINERFLSEVKEKRIEATNDIVDAVINSKEFFYLPRQQTVPKEYFENYEKNVKRMELFIKLFKPDLQKINIERKELEDEYKCKLLMEYKDYSIDAEFESNGIKKLMNLFIFLDIACAGAIVFIDEIDSNINEIYLNKIIEYYMKFGNGQLCFTAHNLSPMRVLKDMKLSISFISSINTVHTWTSNGNQTPENAYREGFIEDSPFNIDANDFLGILGKDDE